MLRFTFLNNKIVSQIDYLKNRQYFQKATALIDKTLKIKSKYYFDVEIVNNEQMHNINKKYRDIDKTTDILSFRLKDSDQNIKLNLLGEIYINIDLAKKQALSNNKTLFYQMTFLFIHGVLHLLEYDHSDKKSYKKMFDLQDKIINRLF